MAFFKFRKSGDEQSATPVQPESIEAMRRRAKHRLMGAAVLVLIGVIGFPLLFDKQPRPISVDIPIEIPDRNKVKPLRIPEPVAVQKSEPQVPVAPEAPKIVAKAESVLPDMPAAKVLPTPDKAPEAAKAQLLPEGSDTKSKADASAGRFVVQVGAFADLGRAREVRLKVEHAGMKTYTQEVETREGRRIRVRVGPFAGKAEAEKAAEAIRRLALPATILTL